jgi:hypothetical protein
MTIYNNFRIEQIENSIKIILKSRPDTKKVVVSIQRSKEINDASSEITVNYLFVINLNDYTDHNKQYHKLLFGQLNAESKSWNNIQLRHNKTKDTLYVTEELLLNLIQELHTLANKNNNDYFNYCVGSWHFLINSLSKEGDFATATLELKFKPTSELIIYIPETPTLYDQENIVNACGEFMEALGFEMKTEDEPVYNSFWQKIKFIFKKNVTEQDVQNLFDKGKKALELKHVELPTAEQTEKLANATEKILHSIEKFDNCTIRLGSLLIVKRMVGPEPILKIHQLTLEEIKYIEENNSILKQSDPIASLTQLINAGERGYVVGIDGTTYIAQPILPSQITETTESGGPNTNENKEITTDPVVDVLPENINKEGGVHGQAKL